MFNPFASGEDVRLDFVVLAGQISPGLCFVRGANSPRKWDKQQGYGSDGAFLKWTGDDLSEFTVTFQAWDESIFTAWDTFREIVKKSPTNVAPKVLDIRHALLEELDIHSVVVLDVTQWDVADDTGMWEKEVKFSVYRAPKPALAAPKSAIDKPDNPDDAQDATDRLIAGLQSKLNDASTQAANTP